MMEWACGYLTVIMFPLLNVPIAFALKYRRIFLSFWKQTFVVKHTLFNLIKQMIKQVSWIVPIGDTKKPKRWKLPSHNGLFICPVAHWESKPYQSTHGCRKHIFVNLNLGPCKPVGEGGGHFCLRQINPYNSTSIHS